MWPHEPQLRISFAKSTQPALQAMRPVGQEAAHALFAHSGVAPLHTVPHVPQLAGSSLVLVQVAPQMSPCTQPCGTTQKLMPVTQTWAAGQDSVEEHGCSPPGPELLQADARKRKTTAKTAFLTGDSASTAKIGLVGERMDSNCRPFQRSSAIESFTHGAHRNAFPHRRARSPPRRHMSTHIPCTAGIAGREHGRPPRRAHFLVEFPVPVPGRCRAFGKRKGVAVTGQQGGSRPASARVRPRW